ncbi:MAG: C10 family peptidase [Muribaculaceae bacterium]|nr:C10 family peptidase [Muribaculaceae bacterium]
MKNPLVLLTLACGACLPAMSASLTPEQALSRFENNGPQQVRPMSDNAGGMTLHATYGNLYVFTGSDGFVVLPADDRAPVLLAYSDKTDCDFESNPGLAYWFGYYNREIDLLKSQAVSQPTEYAPVRETRREIAPLLKTEWNQEAPYNDLCPKVDGHETVTGCVATAMAQVMKYYNYPEHGKGKHSYFWRPGEEELSFDYDSTPFQWSLMTDRYDDKSSAESRHAVAELMLACGISVDMHYEPGGSGAATTVMGESLIDIFDYSPSIWMPQRAYYGYDEWEAMIYADLAEGMPVLYSGAGTAGGHQFVCDGYASDGFFHFNWGWGGMSNGYFLLTALNPANLGVGGGAGGFNSSQTATLGVRRPEAGDRRVYLFYNNRAFSTDAATVKAGERLMTEGLYFNYSLSTMPDGSRLGLKFVSADGSTVKYVDGPGVGGYRPDDGRENIEIIFPELADGTYTITPALYADGGWSDVRMPVGYRSEVTAEVKDRTATLKNQTDAEIEVRDVELPATVYRDRDFPMPFSVVSTNHMEYYGSVTPFLLDSKGDAVAKSQFRPVDVMAGKTDRIEDYIADFSALDGKEFPAGDYRLVFRDEAGKDVSSPVDVKVTVLDEDTEIGVSDFRLDGTSPILDPSKVKFSFKVNCTSGYFFEALQLYLFPGSGGDDVYHRESERIYLTKGDSREVTITADLEHLRDGEYLALIYKGSEAVSGRVYFNIDRTSGICEITVNENDEPGAIYDIHGRRVSHPTSTGLYLVNGHKVIVSENY